MSSWLVVAARWCAICALCLGWVVAALLSIPLTILTGGVLVAAEACRDGIVRLRGR